MEALGQSGVTLKRWGLQKRATALILKEKKWKNLRNPIYRFIPDVHKALEFFFKKYVLSFDLKTNTSCQPNQSLDTATTKAYKDIFMGILPALCGTAVNIKH